MAEGGVVVVVVVVVVNEVVSVLDVALVSIVDRGYVGDVNVG